MTDGSGSVYRARYYDPIRSRFLSEDPIGLNRAVNTYAYVGNSSTVYIDPLGLGRIPYAKMAKMVAMNNRSGFGNELILCIAWKESSRDPARRHGSKTEIGLTGMTRDASKDVKYDYYRDVSDSNEVNIAAGSAYLKLRVAWEGRNLKKGIQGYGTGADYPVEKILKCEQCLKKLPPDIAWQGRNLERSRTQLMCK